MFINIHVPLGVTNIVHGLRAFELYAYRYNYSKRLIVALMPEVAAPYSLLLARYMSVNQSIFCRS